MLIFFLLRHPSIYNNLHNYNDTQNKMTYENKENAKSENVNKEIQNKDTKESKKNATRVILDSKENNKVNIMLSNVKSTNYYKLSEPFENRSLFSDVELDKKGLRNKIESQLYIGELGSLIVIFADKKCNDTTVDKNGGYMAVGVMSSMDEEIGNKIKNKYASAYPGIEWISDGFIDASKTEKK
jgi:hypothetical protein